LNSPAPAELNRPEYSGLGFRHDLGASEIQKIRKQFSLDILCIFLKFENLIFTHTLYHKFEKYDDDDEQTPGFSIQNPERIKNRESHISKSEENALSDRGMDSGDIDFPAIVEFLEKIEKKSKERASREKTGNPHDRQSHN